MTGSEKKLLVAGIAAAIVYAVTRTKAGQAVAVDAVAGIIHAGGVVADAVSNLPRGIRNNNPGNIRWLPAARAFKGQKPEADDRGFGVYDSPAYGVRALGKQLLAYHERGLSTVRKIIETYAPATENNTSAYVAAVAKALNTAADSPIPVPDVLAELAAAIIRHENGAGSWYTEREIRAWVYLT